MKRTTAFLALVVSYAVCFAVYADYAVVNKGTWPESWPKELETLRKQSRTLQGSLANLTTYEIPFANRESFESAWPHFLKIKSKGAPVVLLRGPDENLGQTINAGIRVRCPPPPHPKYGVTAPVPVPGATSVKERWIWTTYIELVVDGNIVDLNRIPLPEDTPIIDQRFEGGKSKSLNRNGG